MSRRGGTRTRRRRPVPRRSRAGGTAVGGRSTTARRRRSPGRRTQRRGQPDLQRRLPAVEQATPGKLLLGLRVRLRETPGPMPLGTILVRWLTQFAPSYLLGQIPFV